MFINQVAFLFINILLVQVNEKVISVSNHCKQ